MRARQESQAAFTLIELLTVIAIIMILAGLTAAGVSRAITNAEISSLESRMRNISTLLVDYYTTNATYPPRYGYVQIDIRDTVLDCNDNGIVGDANIDVTPRQDADCLNESDADEGPAIAGTPTESHDHFVLTTYMNLLNEAGNLDLYDPFSTGYDTDNDGAIHMLEYGTFRDVDAEDATDGDSLYDGTNNANAVNELRFDAEQRPILYFPVNKRQAERVGKWIVDNLDANNPLPDDFTTVNAELQTMGTSDPDLVNPPVIRAEFPPPKYDAFVLMSVGPNENTFGMVTELAQRIDLAQYDSQYRYHIMGTVLYYVLSRDADNDGLLDFHFIDRTRNGETDFQLLDPTLPNGVGPYIFVSN